MAFEETHMSQTRQTKKSRARSQNPTHSPAHSGDLNLVLRRIKQSFFKLTKVRIDLGFTNQSCLEEGTGTKYQGNMPFIIAKHRGSLRNGGMIEADANASWEAQKQTAIIFSS